MLGLLASVGHLRVIMGRALARRSASLATRQQRAAAETTQNAHSSKARLMEPRTHWVCLKMAYRPVYLAGTDVASTWYMAPYPSNEAARPLFGRTARIAPGPRTRRREALGCRPHVGGKQRPLPPLRRPARGGTWACGRVLGDCGSVQRELRGCSEWQAAGCMRSAGAGCVSFGMRAPPAPCFARRSRIAKRKVRLLADAAAEQAASQSRFGGRPPSPSGPGIHPRRPRRLSRCPRCTACDGARRGPNTAGRAANDGTGGLLLHARRFTRDPGSRWSAVAQRPRAPAPSPSPQWRSASARCIIESTAASSHALKHDARAPSFAASM